MKAAKKQAARFPKPQTLQKNIGGIDGALPGAGDSGQRICWRFKHVDNDGPWGISHLTGEEFCEIVAKLTSFEGQTLRELFNNGEEPGKHYLADALPNAAARQRLIDLKLADMTRISRLRLGGKPRLYGFLIENVFHVVFWDPEHQIWPSQKKHT